MKAPFYKVFTYFFLFFIVMVFLYVSFSAKGSEFFFQTLLKLQTHGQVSWKSFEGNLTKRVTINELQIQEIRYLPEGAVAVIDQLEAFYPFPHFYQFEISLHNGKLSFPNESRFFFFGNYSKSHWNLDIYSERLKFQDIQEIYDPLKRVRDVTGTFNSLDAFLTGSPEEFLLEGELLLEEIEYQDFRLSNSDAAVVLEKGDKFFGRKTQGTITLLGGVATSSHFARIQLERAVISFQKTFSNPQLNITAKATVGSTKINIQITGTLEEPVISLTSDRAYSEQQLLMILIANSELEGIQESYEKKEFDTKLISDLLKLYFRGREGASFLSKLGLSGVSASITKTSKQVEVKKNLTDRLGVNYEYQTQTEEGDAKEVKQSIGAEVKMTPKISLAAEKEFTTTQTGSELGQDNSESDERVMLKFKTQF